MEVDAVELMSWLVMSRKMIEMMEASITGVSMVSIPPCRSFFFSFFFLDSTTMWR